MVLDGLENKLVGCTVGPLEDVQLRLSEEESWRTRITSM